MMSLEIPVSKEEAIRNLYAPIRRFRCEKCGEYFAGKKLRKKHLAEVHSY